MHITHGSVLLMLGLLESGVETFDIDLKEQKVTVKGNVKQEDVFKTVSKTRKKTFWESEAAPSTTAEAPAATAPEAPPANADA